jgi:dUTP pyrophosphatase
MNDDRQKVLEKIKEDYFKIEVEVLEGGKLPFKANPTDAGFDLFATADIRIEPGEVQKHPLNIKLKLPKGTWAEITSKSGLGAKGLLVYAGVIDQDYRGIPHVVMSNIKMTTGLNEHGTWQINQQPIIIKAGEKLAQLIMSPYSPEYYMKEVATVDTNTSRGAGGFGSTGK